MAQEIDLFQTISRHQSPLTQSKTTIRCLVDVLEYLGMHLTDENANDLMLLITGHLNAIGAPYPHYINMALIRDDIIDEICSAMTTNGQYSDSRESFTMWLTQTVDYYETDVVNPDILGTGIVLGLALSHLRDHDLSIDAHEDGIAAVIDKWYPTFIPVSIFSASSSSRFDFRKMRQVDKEIATLLTNRTDINLINYPPVDPVVNYNENEDLALSIISYWQADREGIIGINDPNMLDYEKVMTPVFKKEMDYYTNHLNYALSSTYDAAYTTTITGLRQDVNPFYYKVFDFYTRLYKNNFSLFFVFDINQFATKTLDLMNMIGLSKSLVCVSLIPYTAAGVDYNKVVCSFDNFNPDFTETLFEDIVEGDSLKIKVIVTANENNEFVVYWSVGDNYGMTVFDSTTRRFNQDLRYLFVPPRVGYPDRDTIRISEMSAFNEALTHDQALYLISDFAHRP